MAILVPLGLTCSAGSVVSWREPTMRTGQGRMSYALRARAV